MSIQAAQSDTSSVYPDWVSDRLWWFQPAEDELPDQLFDSEEAACAYQRAYREARGFDQMTGELPAQ